MQNAGMVNPRLEEIKHPELEQCINSSRERIKLFNEYNSQLSRIGHRLVDTNYPQDGCQQECATPKPQPGYIADLWGIAQLEVIELEQLRATIAKLNDLI